MSRQLCTTNPIYAAQTLLMDAAERRRIQNRDAQRRFRSKSPATISHLLVRGLCADRAIAQASSRHLMVQASSYKHSIHLLRQSLIKLCHRWKITATSSTHIESPGEAGLFIWQEQS
ncbi:hypothetical protein AUP68_12092 [Ilyonectria robusta]